MKISQLLIPFMVFAGAIGNIYKGFSKHDHTSSTMDMKSIEKARKRGKKKKYRR